MGELNVRTTELNVKQKRPQDMGESSSSVRAPARKKKVGEEVPRREWPLMITNSNRAYFAKVLYC